MLSYATAEKRCGEKTIERLRWIEEKMNRKDIVSIAETEFLRNLRVRVVHKERPQRWGQVGSNLDNCGRRGGVKGPCVHPQASIFSFIVPIEFVDVLYG